MQISKNPYSIFNRFWTLAENISFSNPSESHLRKNFYFLAFSALAVFNLLFTTMTFYVAREELPGISTLLGSLFLCANIYFWYKGMSLVMAHLVFQSTLMALILFNTYHLGGITSPAMVWLCIVPVGPFFVTNRAWSYFWLGVTFCTVVIAYFVQYGLRLIPAHQVTVELWASTFGLLTYTQIMVMVIYDYATTRQFLREVQTNNERLQNYSDRLQVLNTEKDKFLATVSHELRTPLTAIMGYLDLLKSNPQIPAVAHDQISQAHLSSKLLHTVINDLLDFTQIKQGKFSFNPRWVNTSQTLSAPHDMLRAKAQARQLDFRIELAPNLPSTIYADPDRLSQIIINLLDNAIKCTQQGSIVLEAHFVSKSSTQNHLHLKISDTGSGIPPHSQSVIFEPFVQLDNHAATGTQSTLRGNGLGLSIIQNLVQAWGGTIQVTSEVGVGSTFEIWLPVKVQSDVVPQNASDTNHVTPPIYKGTRRILIVDDHALNRMVASATILSQMPNALIDEAKNGTEAFNKMSSKLYDIVLMDLVMPDMSGIEVVRKIRNECQAPYSLARVAAFTANQAEQAMIDCAAVGMHDILSKPLDKEALFQIIR